MPRLPQRIRSFNLGPKPICEPIAHSVAKRFRVTTKDGIDRIYNVSLLIWDKMLNGPMLAPDSALPEETRAFYRKKHDDFLAKWPGQYQELEKRLSSALANLLEDGSGKAERAIIYAELDLAKRRTKQLEADARKLKSAIFEKKLRMGKSSGSTIVEIREVARKRGIDLQRVSDETIKAARAKLLRDAPTPGP